MMRARAGQEHAEESSKICGHARTCQMQAKYVNKLDRFRVRENRQVGGCQYTYGLLPERRDTKSYIIIEQYC